MTRTTEHRFLTGNYAPVPDETIITGLRVDGELPRTLSGRYLRIGPNPIGNAVAPNEWRTADPMVHAVTLHAGRAVSYRNRWIRTDRASLALGVEPVPGPRPSPDAPPPTRLATAARDCVLAYGDGDVAYELSRDLETLRRVRSGSATSDDGQADAAEGSGHRRGFARVANEHGDWLLGFVHDEVRNEAELVVLDARRGASAAAPAVAVVRIPRRIPYGLHGIWVPADR